MQTILLVENDPRIMQMNSEMLVMQGYVVLEADTVKQCRNQLYWHTVDLVVMEFMLQDGNSFVLYNEIKEKYHIPVLLLDAENKSGEIVNNQQVDVKDILTGPYDLHMLAERVCDSLTSWEETNRYIHYGSLKMDLIWNCGYINNKAVQLTEREYEVLLMLVKNAGDVVPVSHLTREIWHADPDGSIQTLWTMMSRLRKKICSEESGLELTSVRGMGYKLEII